ncbi:MAG: hypothetical protein HZC55_00220 [Verrucomicrobia bacterium]|nr:hypothetical protein [Verrucomicrobiota bacterium]
MDQALSAIIEDLAGRADDLLAEARDRAQARATLAEELTLEHGWLDAEARAEVLSEVMRILEDEDFFGIEFVGDPFSEAEDNDE